MQEFCWKHQLLRPACEQCGQCATEADQVKRRDTLDILESRIADQDSAISGLRRQIIELRHIVLDVQRAHIAMLRTPVYIGPGSERWE